MLHGRTRCRQVLVLTLLAAGLCARCCSQPDQHRLRLARRRHRSARTHWRARATTRRRRVSTRPAPSACCSAGTLTSHCSRRASTRSRVCPTMRHACSTRRAACAATISSWPALVRAEIAARAQRSTCGIGDARCVAGAVARGAGARRVPARGPRQLRVGTDAGGRARLRRTRPCARDDRGTRGELPCTDRGAAGGARDGHRAHAGATDDERGWFELSALAATARCTRSAERSAEWRAQHPGHPGDFLLPARRASLARATVAPSPPGTTPPRIQHGRPTSVALLLPLSRQASRVGRRDPRRVHGRVACRSRRSAATGRRLRHRQ